MLCNFNPQQQGRNVVHNLSFGAVNLLYDLLIY